MTGNRKWLMRALLIAALAIFGVGPAIGSEDVPFVDGKMWKQTAKPLKQGLSPLRCTLLARR